MKFIPYLAKHAALYENCHEPGNSRSKAASHVPPFWAPEYLAVYYSPTDGGKPYTDGATPFTKFLDADIGGKWTEAGMAEYPALFGQKFQALFAQLDPQNGASVTLSHGDLRGDNLFFTETNPGGWMAIDFQLMFKGPIASDLAYLMGSGSVLPEVYNDNEDVVLRAFYDEFQKHTKDFKENAFPFSQFKREYSIMTHVLYLYFTCFGAPIFLSGAVDGKADPSKPDEVVGPIYTSPELGSGAITVDMLTPEDLRKRMWFSNVLPNIRDILKRHNMMDFLKSLPDNNYGK
jgi:hypothetical protein